MERKSEYFSSLSASAKDRYERKVVATRLGIDPYTIECWREDLEVFPEVNCSDMIMYLTAMQSEYTREAIKVLFVSQTINVLGLCHLNIGLERNA